jgi:hypothetical protein
MTLGDIFDRLFKLIGKTWIRNLIIAAVILGPAALIMGAAADMGFSELAQVMENRDSGDPFTSTELSTMVGFALWFAIGLTLMIIGSVIATVAVTIVACAEMSNEPLSWQEALSRTFHVRVVKVFGQYILEGALFTLIVIIPYVLLIIGIAVDSVALGFVGGFLIFAGILFAVYLGISFAFTVPAISWEDADVIESFKRSWALVRGNWWRTFGILILMGMMVSFAASIIMTPFYLIFLWDFFQAYFEAISSMTSGTADPAIFVSMIKSLGFGIGILSGISSIIQLVVTPLYSVVMYFDLRARRGEFSQPVAGISIP